MKLSRMKELIDSGFDIEISYQGKTYWITWGKISERGNSLYFYEAYADDVAEFKTSEELLSGSYRGEKISKLIERLDEDKDLGY